MLVSLLIVFVAIIVQSILLKPSVAKYVLSSPHPASISSLDICG